VSFDCYLGQTAVTITPNGPLPGVSFIACADQLLVPSGCDSCIALPGIATAPPPNSVVPGGHVDVASSLVEYWLPMLFATPGVAFWLLLTPLGPWGPRGPAGPLGPTGPVRPAGPLLPAGGQVICCSLLRHWVERSLRVRCPVLRG
jgi:hypothetical protein